ncbi:hypothetical protein TM239_40650 [Bradyrhizobium sp. TM239]|nr:hypothetical protein TM239_40650 [Bradyrhizobium sp. TM239]
MVQSRRQVPSIPIIWAEIPRSKTTRLLPRWSVFTAICPLQPVIIRLPRRQNTGVLANSR